MNRRRAPLHRGNHHQLYMACRIWDFILPVLSQQQLLCFYSRVVDFRSSCTERWYGKKLPNSNVHMLHQFRMALDSML
eukprot:scaffold188509_cov16-Tisochrysis_lutea.AAC.1